MPGIVGYITRLPRERAQAEVVRMIAVLRHEDFYVDGMWTDESLGVYVGWVAQEGSFSDGMPLLDEREDTVLVFSGEEFAKPGTAEWLKGRGHEFDMVGPSYLVHLYEEDPSFPRGLSGRFHGLVVDRKRRSAVLFNDRYAMHRLYYHQSKDGFYFASEAKAILAVCPELRTLDSKGAGELVACGCVMENRTLFKGIQVLPPASAWVFQNASLGRKDSYFHPREWEDQETLDPESYYKELRQVFTQNLPRYFSGPQRIGMSLTGGLDTRMIMAWQMAKPGSLPCYTYGGMLRGCRDVIVARQVAFACGQSHDVIPVGHEFLSRFGHYAERAVYLTDGCVDVSRAPDLYLSERAREFGPVRMTGLYGSEVLRSVRAFRPEEPPLGLFSPDIVSRIREAKETYFNVVQGHPVSFSAFKQAPYYHYGVLALEQTQLSVRTPFLDNDLVRTVFRAPALTAGATDVSLRLIADGRAALLRIPTDRGIGGARSHILGVATHALLEFLFKAEYGYDMGMPQWVARMDHLLSPLRLERLFLGRHKIFHFRTWYRDSLAGYVRETLLDPRSLSRPYVTRERLESVVQGHLGGGRNYTTELHKLLTLELVHRLFLDSRSDLSRNRNALLTGGARRHNDWVASL